MSKERRKLVIWSGGLDSTTLLDQFARESTKEKPILTFSFETDFLQGNKVVKEREVRKNYLKYAKKMGYHIDSRTIKVKSDISVVGRGWPQQVFWMSFILPFIPEDSDVNIGFVQGDCVWMAVSNFYTIFNEFKYIGNRENVKLSFPFAYTTKCEVWKKFKEAKIPHNCFWTCEFPVKTKTGIRSCGRCNPCISLVMAKKELKCRNKRKGK